MAAFFYPARAASRRYLLAAALGLIGSTTSSLGFAAEPSTATASSRVGAIHGVFVDASGNAVSAAKVQLLDDSGKLVAQSRTANDGSFAIQGVVAGHFTLTASKPGIDPISARVEVAAGGTAEIKLSTATELSSVNVVAKRFERARNELSPSTGSSQYVFDHQAIENLPEGENTPLNRLLLQAPGVANDSYGQLHVRGDHADLQYRINGVILPEGVASFGQTFDTHFADKVDLLTGALPAQYGYRTAGIVDITTKKNFSGGSIDLYGGSHSTINPSAQYGYSNGGFSSFVTGSYLSSTLGVEPPTSGANAIHDRTTQGRGFGYLSYILNDNLKVSGIFGSSMNRLEIPNNPGQTPDPGFLQQLGLSGYDSSTLNDRQFERNNYGIVALQGVGANDLNYQVALFGRQSAVQFEPDVIGDLAFNGDASKVKRKSETYGLQADASYPITTKHTLRAGLFASTENDRSDNTSSVFCTYPQTAPDNPECPAQTDPNQTLAGPINIVDNNPKNGNNLFGVYVQDQWDISDTFTLNYGLRYDKLHAFVDASQVSPRIGAIWYPTPGTTVHAGYARYFTPPVNELIANTSIARFDNTTNAFEVQDNSPVQPERQHYFDVGVLQRVLPSLTLGVDAYYKYIRELQDEGQFGQALIFAPFNYQQGHVGGIELTSAFHQGNLSAYLNLARSRANATRVESGQFNFGPDDIAYINSHYIYLDHDQSLTISGGASYLLYGTTFGIAGTYGSGLRKDAVDADGNTLIPNGAKLTPNLQIDLSAARTVHISDGFGNVDLRMAVLNVLDRSNIIHDGTGVGVGVAQYGPRAALYFGITKPFGAL
ncbi:MAG: TonB-dependent receptor [Nevskia sp.]|nr:TonB-dependent receptor [Nevskia sp.]